MSKALLGELHCTRTCLVKSEIGLISENDTRTHIRTRKYNVGGSTVFSLTTVKPAYVVTSIKGPPDLSSYFLPFPWVTPEDNFVCIFQM